MNKSITYIKQNYNQYITDHVYISFDNKDYIKKGQLIKAIDKNSLQLKLNGKISEFDKNYNFIRSYNLINKRIFTIYFDQYYIFVKNIVNKDELFKQKVLSFIKKVEKNNIK